MGRSFLDGSAEDALHMEPLLQQEQGDASGPTADSGGASCEDDDDGAEPYNGYYVKPELLTTEQRNVRMWGFDLFMLVLLYLQLYGIVMYMAPNWPWPYTWISQTYFLVLANLDGWGFLELGQFDGNARFILSSKVPITYKLYMMVWGGIMFGTIAFFALTTLICRKCRPRTQHLETGKLCRWLLKLLSILWIPMSLAALRTYVCRSADTFAGVVPDTSLTNVVGMMNEVECYSMDHLILMGGSIGGALLFWVAIPTIMILLIRRQVLTRDKNRHERLLQSFERQYLENISDHWTTTHTFLLSSYTRRWAYFRPVMLLWKLGLVAGVIALHDHQSWQALFAVLWVLLAAITFTLFRPFRIKAFNPPLLVVLWGHVFNFFLGYCDAAEIRSALLLDDNLYIFLVMLNGLVVLALAVTFIMLQMRNRHICFKKNLWKVWKPYKADELDARTSYSLRLILESRDLVNSSFHTPPMLVPTDEMALRISLITELLKEDDKDLGENELLEILEDTLDQLINVYNIAAPQSIFTSSKQGAVETGRQLRKLLPGFKRCLDRRDRNMILVSPEKRRMILKLFTAAMILNGRVLAPSGEVIFKRHRVMDSAPHIMDYKA